LKGSFDVAETANSADRREQFVLVGTVQTLQKDMAEASNTIKSLQQALSDCTRHVRFLQGEYQAQADSLTQLREGQKVTNTNVHCLKTDLGKKAEDIKNLQNMVDEIKTVTQTRVQMTIDHLDQRVSQLMDDNSINRCGLNEQKAMLQGHESQLKSNGRSIVTLTEKVASNTKKIDETAQQTHATKTNLELTNGVVMQLHADQEMADKNIRELKTETHHLKARLEKTNDDLAGTGKNLHEAREELLSTAALSGSTRDVLMQAVERIKALQEDHSLSRNAIDNLGRNLESVQNVAHHTKEDLKLTNAFVLPNLGADSSVSPTSVLGGTANMGYGSLGSTGKSTDSARSTGGRNYRSGPNSPTRSPRVRKKDMAWYARNIGSIPDRNSWI